MGYKYTRGFLQEADERIAGQNRLWKQPEIFLRNGELRMINREDMLELTRRMTPSRTCMDRIAGGYMDEDGFLDGSFNIHFLKLSGEEKAKNLALAKAVPFSKTNEQLKEYEFSPTQERPGSLWQLLMAMREARLKNDA